MTRFRVFPYNQHSGSARALAEALGGRRLRREGSNYRHRPENDLVVNWGASGCPEFERMLNTPQAVALAADKVRCFARLNGHGISTPRHTTHREEARRWFEHEEGVKVYCRTLTRANSGRGIVVADNPGDVVPAPLYVKGIVGPRREYRVHVFGGEVIRVQQKRRRTETAGEGYEANEEVRNLSGGWVFTANNITPIDSDAQEAAVDAVDALGLDFGAVDIITQRGNHWVLEVNTACGLEGSTLDAYVVAIQEHANPSPSDPDTVADVADVSEPVPSLEEEDGTCFPIGAEVTAEEIVRAGCRGHYEPVDQGPYFSDDSIVYFASGGCHRATNVVGSCSYNNGVGRTPGMYVSGPHLFRRVAGSQGQPVHTSSPQVEPYSVGDLL